MEFIRKVFGKRSIKKSVKIPFKMLGNESFIPKDIICIGAENISIGERVYFGERNTLYAERAPLVIGNRVVTGEYVTISTGEHRTDLVGEYMRNITNEMKLESNDQPVVIEDDVWIASRVTILKGVTIGHGSYISTGNVIDSNVPPYTIYINDKLQLSRFSNQE